MLENEQFLTNMWLLNPDPGAEKIPDPAATLQMTIDICGNFSSYILKIALKEHYFNPVFSQFSGGHTTPELSANDSALRASQIPHIWAAFVRRKSRKTGRKIKSQNEGGRNQINARIYTPGGQLCWLARIYLKTFLHCFTILIHLFIFGMLMGLSIKKTKFEIGRQFLLQAVLQNGKLYRKCV